MKNMLRAPHAELTLIERVLRCFAVAILSRCIGAGRPRPPVRRALQRPDRADRDARHDDPDRHPHHRRGRAQPADGLRRADIARAGRLLRARRIRLGHPHHARLPARHPARDRGYLVVAVAGDRRRNGAHRRIRLPGGPADPAPEGQLPGDGHARAGFHHQYFLRRISGPHRRQRRPDGDPAPADRRVPALADAALLLPGVGRGDRSSSSSPSTSSTRGPAGRCGRSTPARPRPPPAGWTPNARKSRCW